MGRRIVTLAALLATAAGPAIADEGMWLPDAFPAAKVQAAYGFAPDQAWLDRVRLGALNLSGCSASIVSASGLVMTNHHCVEDCLAELSKTGQDTLATGFLAATPEAERRCTDLAADQLRAVTDVTEQIGAATRGKEAADFAAALKSVKASLAAACEKSEPNAHCEIVTLYRGGRYELYKYRRFADLRLVFTPETASADFGGDPDNFEFPRYAFDIAFVRIYENGKPMDTSAWRLHLANREAVPGEPVFTAGNPGWTRRLYTLAQLEEDRDRSLPRACLYYAELRGVLTDFAQRDAESRRIAESDLLGVENTVKALRGLWRALSDPAVFTAKRRTETELRNGVAADPRLHQETGTAWDDIAAAVVRHRAVSDRNFLLEAHTGGGSRLLGDALILVRHAAEAAKPEGERLSDYTDANFAAHRADLLSERPVAPRLESVELGFWLSKVQELLGPDDPDVRALLAGANPQVLAASLVHGSKLGDPHLRQRLLEGGAKAIDAAHDPMIEFAQLLDPLGRKVRGQIEADYDFVLDSAGGRIARATFALYGTGVAPDATGTFRISYGTLEGWSEPGKTVGPVTRIGGLWQRATGNEPFKLAPSWLAAKDSLDPGTLLNMATSNDVVGGNSGSPVIDRKGDIVGLVFDGNFPSLAGDYYFDPATNRTVSVAAPVIWVALNQVYHADRLVTELGN